MDRGNTSVKGKPNLGFGMVKHRVTAISSKRYKLPVLHIGCINLDLAHHRPKRVYIDGHERKDVADYQRWRF